MDIKNTEYFISNRISKKKRQHRNRCLNETRKQDHSKKKKIFLNKLILNEVKKQEFHSRINVV